MPVFDVHVNQSSKADFTNNSGSSGVVEVTLRHLQDERGENTTVLTVTMLSVPVLEVWSNISRDGTLHRFKVAAILNDLG